MGRAYVITAVGLALVLFSCDFSCGEEEKVTLPSAQVTIQKSSYDAIVKDNKVLFTGSYEIEGTGKGEVSLPFLRDGVVFLSTNLPSKKGVLLPDRHGGIKLVLFDARKLNFEVSFLTSLESVDGWQKLVLKLPESVITQMNIRLPGKGYQVKRLSSFALEEVHVPAVPVSLKGEKVEELKTKEDTILRIAAGMEREVALSFRKEEVLPEVNCEFHLSDTIGVSLEGIRRNVELTCIPISGRVATVDILLNEGEKATSLSSDIPHVWKQDKNILTISLIEPCEKNFSLELTTNISKIKMDATTIVSSLRIEKAQRFGGILRLRVDKGLEAEVIEFEGLKKFGEFLDGVADAYIFAEGYRAILGISRQESKITSKTCQRFRIQEKKISLVLNSELQVEGLPVYSLKFDVPSDYKILEATSNGLTEWAYDDNHLILKYGGGLIGTTTIDLVGEKEVDGLAETGLKVEGIGFPPEARDEGVVMIETELPLQLRPKDLYLLIETVSPEKGKAREALAAISYGYRKAGWSLVLERELLTPSISTKVATIIELKRDYLEGESSLDFDISDAGIKEIGFSITGGVEGVEAKGKYIRSVQETPAEEKATRWKVTLEKHILGDYELKVKYKQYISPETETLSLPAFELEKVDTVQGKLEIKPASSLEAKVEDVKNLEETKQLTYIYYRQPYALSMKLKLLDLTGVLETFVEAGSISSVVSSTGEVITRASISLKNTVNQYLNIVLPEKASLWQVKVDGRSVRPGFYENGCLISLGGREARFRSIPIELTYAENLHMSLRGFPPYVKLTSPSFEIPAKSMDWTVYVPSEIKAVGFRTNLEKTTLGEIQTARREVQLARYDSYRGTLSVPSQAPVLHAGKGEEMARKEEVAEGGVRAGLVARVEKEVSPPTRRVEEEAKKKKLEKIKATQLELKGLSEELDMTYGYGEVTFSPETALAGEIEIAEPEVETPVALIPPLTIDMPKIGTPYYFSRAILGAGQGPLYIEISRGKEIKYLRIIIPLLTIAILLSIAFKKHRK